MSNFQRFSRKTSSKKISDLYSSWLCKKIFRCKIFLILLECACSCCSVLGQRSKVFKRIRPWSSDSLDLKSCEWLQTKASSAQQPFPPLYLIMDFLVSKHTPKQIPKQTNWHSIWNCSEYESIFLFFAGLAHGSLKEHCEIFDYIKLD